MQGTPGKVFFMGVFHLALVPAKSFFAVLFFFFLPDREIEVWRP